MSRLSDARERLLDAAIDLIWTSSYGAVGVDHICERAEVKKGSFYHFFPSKVDLALAAYDEHWARRQPEYDRIFCPLNPPLERILSWCRFIRNKQVDLHQRHGFICGCAYCNIGSELATQDERFRQKSGEMMHRTRIYIESAVRDADRLGEICVDDVGRMAEAVQSCVVGQILLAKVHNDPSMLNQLEDGVLRQLGAQKMLSMPERAPSVSVSKSALLPVSP